MLQSDTPDHPYPADLRSLTSLRIFFAIGVVLFHFQLQTDLAHGYSTIIERSRLAVDGFFMLSGFILAHVYGPAVANRTFSYRAFIVARIARLYPMHLVVLAFALVMVVTATVTGIAYDRSGYSVRGFFETLLLIQSWFPGKAGINWNGPTWSLSAEWFAYLAFPLFAVLALRFRAYPLILLAIGVAGFVLLDVAYRHMFGKVLPRAEEVMGVARVAPEFLVGMGLYGLGLGLRVGRMVAISATVVSVVILFTAMRLSLDDRLIVGLTAPLILSFSLLAKARCEGILASRPLVFAGEISFALYLVHMPVLVAWKGLVAELRGIDSGFIVSKPELFTVILASLAIAVLMHLVIELPGRRWTRRWLAPARRPSAAEVARTPG